MCRSSGIRLRSNVLQTFQNLKDSNIYPIVLTFNDALKLNQWYPSSYASLYAISADHEKNANDMITMICNSIIRYGIVHGKDPMGHFMKREC